MNFGQLKAAVSVWANRSDVIAQLPVFMELAEQRIYFGMKTDGRVIVEPLRISQMLETTGVISTSANTLPAGFLEAKSIKWVTGGRLLPLDYIPLEKIESTLGAPAYFSLQNQSVVFSPQFDGQYEMLYYKRFDTPVLDGDANWILQNASGVYLFSIMAEIAGGFLRNMELHQLMQAKYVEAMNSLESQDSAAKSSGGQLRMTSDARMLI